MVVFSGRTVEEAIEKGLRELDLPRLKAHIRVITREKKGFLGFGKKPAQVEINEIVQADSLADLQASKKPSQQELESAVNAETISPEQLEKTVPQAETASKARPARSLLSQLAEEDAAQAASDKEEADKSDLDEAVQGTEQASASQLETAQPEGQEPVNDLPESSGEQGLEAQPLAVAQEQKPTPAEAQPADSEQSFEAFVASEFAEDTGYKDIEQASQDVLAYVEKVIYEMDIEASIEASHNRRQINLQIETAEAGRVIGYHGKVLKSLQVLAQNFLHDRYSKSFSVVLNVHDYVEHRTETLIDFSKKVARRVAESGKDYIMDPMSNSERKLVHKTIGQMAGVTSYSEGDDPNRYVVVTVKD